METKALLLTDLVDSAALAARLGDAAMAALSAAHDRAARDLLRAWHGREIDKTDGFLLLFDSAGQALGYALAYHRALATLAVPLKARAGLHVGAVTLRETPADDVARGAKPVEVDGVAKPLAARVMATALGGQTLLTAEALAALEGPRPRLVSHGHWRVKGLPEPVEIFEAGDEGAPFMPPPDGDKVYRVVRQGELWLPAREIRHSLPAERDAFVGRKTTLQELARRFDGDVQQLALQDLARRFAAGARLVSLLGIGGCGKTRLATHFGWLEMGSFPGGVWFCDLAAAREVEGLCSAVAQGLDLPLGKEDPVVQLGHAIAGRGNCLVILDNFEQLARHAEATLGRWMDRAGEARFLVTTREVLGIAGEETMALAPLQQTDAEALFLRRAAAARRDFDPTPEDRAAVAPLVRLLDGLPLAIELAAARVRTLPPRALLARMSERFKLLASSGHRLDRQSTLRATFDWSWDLLSPAEKAALAQLSVFEGGFTLEAAEAVIELLPPDDAHWAVDVVQSLVDKSFVRALEGERFELLISVQAYADDHLRSEGRWPGSGAAALQAAQARHAAWFAALGAQRAIENRCIEIDNLVAACRRAQASGDAPAAAGALGGAWAALALRGPFQAGADLAEAVCAMPGLGGESATRAYAVRGLVLDALGQRAAARKAFENALSQLQGDSGSACELEARIGLAALRAREGEVEPARASLLATLHLARGSMQTMWECTALNRLGAIDFEQGQLEEARGHWEVALALAQRSGLRRLQGTLLGNLGNLHASAGRIAAARACFEEGLAVARPLGDRQREANSLGNLGLLLWMQGELDAAGKACAAALVVARDLGHVRLEGSVLCNLGQVREDQGLRDEALAHFKDALTVARRMADRRLEGQVLGYLGLSQARQGRHGEAGARLDEGQALLAGLADRLSLGVLLCQRAEAAWLAGDAAASREAEAEAALTATATGAGAESELGQALVRLQRLRGNA
ncbi:TPR_REGION domain-containing protein [Rubrivivax sp. A210]|uniref:tetratricopeptide repeat protein n=1 Tax=Rubrivivax sp. A210 TaxID=2772301 RepID=UPI00191B3645|nr:tetratricopeptide repeat protein [Rubrivivax sp. A210]CAD5369088.1 TPR_REGION domain-containing protein [Rubrivivax sp. A210]